MVNPYFVAGTLLLTAFLAYATYQSALLLRKFVPQENLLLNPAENVVKLLMVAFCLLLARISGLPAAAFGLHYDVAGVLRDGGIGLVGGLLALLAVNFLSEWAVRVWGTNIYSDLVMRLVTPRTGRASVWLAVAAAMAVAVLLEELLFRGLLLGGLSGAAGWMRWLAALPLSVLFGLLHLPQGRLGVVGAGLLSLVLSALFLLTGGLFAPFVAHYLINILQLVRAYRERVWEQPGRVTTQPLNIEAGEERLSAPTLRCSTQANADSAASLWL